jgi:hypothetical protein
MEKTMVTEIMDKVTIQDFRPRIERETQEPQPDIGMGNGAKEAAPSEVVSKDFILGLLSLAIGKPFFLEGNLGANVDLKV